jgi:hypothetical protein
MKNISIYLRLNAKKYLFSHRIYAMAQIEKNRKNSDLCQKRMEELKFSNLYKGINPSFFDFPIYAMAQIRVFFDFFRFMPWHKSDAKKGYIFAFRPGINRNILIYVRGLYPGVYGSYF